MGELNWQKVEEILDHALNLPEEERAAFIHKECKNQPDLRNEVELILASIRESEGWLENPGQFKQEFFDEIAQDLEQLSEEQPLIGKKIGSYKVIKKIGEGGMGSVFLAERSEGDFKHQVAIKLVSQAKATPSTLNQFKKEKRILASLKHPGIAQLYDGGVTDDGIPYIIMEYVDGIPITDYCKKENYSLSQKIKLFQEVLQAVKNAHENLIIHSDLKPDNILIDTSGNVKILDFGISELLKEDDDAKTDSEQLSGTALTPRYAAPEQIEEKNITTATDIYSLGIVFYKLLTEQEAIHFKTTATPEVRRAILEQKPIPPSEKNNPPGLKKKLKGDLDAIVLKAIQKEPSERYRNASDFSNDLSFYLQDLPVSAREITLPYRTSKFLSRHKVGVLFSTMMLIVIVGLTFFYTLQIKEQRNQAEIEAEKAQEITNFVVGLLEENYPENSKGDTVTVRQILDKSTTEIQNINKSPDVKAKMLQVIGHAYNSVGEPQKAKPLLTQAIHILESENIANTDLAHTYNVSGLIDRDLGFTDSAEINLQKAVNIFRELNELEVPEYPKALKNLAYVNRIQSNYEQALSNLEEALTIERKLYEEPDINIAETIYILASTNRYLGNYQQALDYQQQSLDMVRATTDGPHPGIIANLSNIAVLNDILENQEASKKSYHKALDMAKKLFGPEHPEVANISSNLSSIYTKQAQYDSAKVLVEQAIEISSKVIGTEHPRFANYLSNYAHMYYYKGSYLKADSLYRKALQIFQQNYSDTHPEIAAALHNIANVAIANNEYEKARPLLTQALGIRKSNFENDHPKVQENIIRLIDVFQKLELDQKADSLSQFVVNNSD